MITLSNQKKMEVDLNNPYIFYTVFIIGIILDIGIIWKFINSCVPCTENCDSEEDVFSYKPRYSAKSSESVYPETTPFISRISSRISSSGSSEEDLPKLRESTTTFNSGLAEGTQKNLPYTFKTPSTSSIETVEFHSDRNSCIIDIPEEERSRADLPPTTPTKLCCPHLVYSFRGLHPRSGHHPGAGRRGVNSAGATLRNPLRRDYRIRRWHLIDGSAVQDTTPPSRVTSDRHRTSQLWLP
ncbi:hypothetical protein J6590_101216, partial [Homalodisca vitripennis]